MKNKELGLIAIATLILLALTSTAIADSVKTSFTGDMNTVDHNINQTLNESTFTTTLYFPCKLSELSTTASNISIHSEQKTTLNVKVNGQFVKNGYTITPGATNSTTLNTINTTYDVPLQWRNLTLNVTVLDNETTWTNITMKMDDGLLDGQNFSAPITSTNQTTPAVEYYKDNSYFNNRDTVTVTQDSYFNLTDVNTTYSYPSVALNQPVSFHNFSTLNTSESKTHSVLYQKQGPWVNDIDTETIGNYKVTQISIRSLENLKATYEFNPFEDPYDNYFPGLTATNKMAMIENVTLNGDEIDWTDPVSVLEVDDTMSLDAGTNLFNVSYSTQAGAAPVVIEKPWYLVNYGIGWFSAPLYMWLVGITIIGAVIVIAYAGRR